jgi:alanine dehydrogenase
MKDAIESQEKTFMALGLKKARPLQIVHHDVSEYSGHIEIKPGVVVANPVVSGLKLISVYPENAKSGIAPMQAIVMLNDSKSGIPIAIVDGVYITNLRTAAAGAVGAKYLARKDSRRIGVLGTGTQGRLQVVALREIFELESVKVWSPDRGRRRHYEKDMQTGESRMTVAAVDSAREAVQDIDILVTATPARAPIVKNEWIESGLHIDSIGADRRGKQELESAIYKRARLFVDNRQTALEKDLFGPEDIIGELGDVLAGTVRGRVDKADVTIFDSSGIGVQDIIAAEMIFRKARSRKLGSVTHLT